MQFTRQARDCGVMFSEEKVGDFYCDEVLTGSTKVDVMFETNRVLAFHHTRPYYEAHVVVIPKQHIESLTSLNNPDEDLAKDFIAAIAHVAAKVESKFGGCRVSSNVGDYQSAKHLHWYVHAGDRIRDEDGNPIEHKKT